MKITSAILLSLTLTAVHGSLCTDLSGTWTNQLNSNMTIEIINGTSFTGTYHTAVESTRGAARLASKISGLIQPVQTPVEDAKLVGFNVLWNKGASLTAWVGQCIVCDGKAKIYTTWVLRSYMPAKKNWMTTRINQDTFWRLENVADETNPLSNQVIQSNVREGNPSNSGIQGNWISATGSSLNIKEVQESGILKGTHQVENFNFEGRFDGNETYTALGIVSATFDKLKGWTGHINIPQDSSKVLETSWLEHTFTPSCTNPRELVKFGMDTYSKE